MLNHHTHPTDPIRDKKTNAFDTSMASPFRQHNFTVRVSHRYIITAAECGRSRHRPSFALPPCSTLGCSLSLSEFLGALATEFGHSRRVWALLDGDDLYSSAYVCWVVSIIRHSGFAQPRTRTHELDLAGTGSGIVEAGCCDTWVYWLGVTMEAEAETFKK